MKLIIGLGNPGKKYENNRHNVGFMVIDFIAKNLGFSIKNEKKFQAQIGKGQLADQKVILVRPQTFMNLSGQAVVNIAHFYKINSQDIFVIYDDIDLPVGKIRIRKSGSAGGHKGLSSIIQTLKTENIPRFRIGIASKRILNQKGRNAAKFVLEKFNKNEKIIINKIIRKTAEAIELALKQSIEQAMSKYN
jgi:PTH1 family peptidyl-tRNA hydrolase